MNTGGGFDVPADFKPLVLCGGFLVRPEVAERIRALALADGPGTVIIDMSKFDPNHPPDPRLHELIRKALQAAKEAQVTP